MHASGGGAAVWVAGGEDRTQTNAHAECADVFDLRNRLSVCTHFHELSGYARTVWRGHGGRVGYRRGACPGVIAVGESWVLLGASARGLHGGKPACGGGLRGDLSASAYAWVHDEVAHAVPAGWAASCSGGLNFYGGGGVAGVEAGPRQKRGRELSCTPQVPSSLRLCGLFDVWVLLLQSWDSGPLSDVLEARQGPRCAGDGGCFDRGDGGGFCRRAMLWGAFGAAGAEGGDCTGGAAGSAGDSVVGLESYGGDAGGGWVSDAGHGAGSLGGDSGAPERVVAGAGAGGAARVRVSAGDSAVFEECALSGGAGAKHVRREACACAGLDGSVLCGVYRGGDLAGTGGARRGSVWGREHVATVE